MKRMKMKRTKKCKSCLTNSTKISKIKQYSMCQYELNKSKGLTGVTRHSSSNREKNHRSSSNQNRTEEFKHTDGAQTDEDPDRKKSK